MQAVAKNQGAFWKHALLVVALFGAALLVRLYRLEAQSLWLDEGSSWELSRQAWSVLLADLLRPNAAYPLYHVLLKGWMGFAGESEAALRMPSVLAGALAVPLVYLMSLEVARLGLGESRPRAPGICWAGLAAALILLASPFAIWYSQEAKVYSLLLFNATLALWALARVLRTGAMRDWALLVVVGVLALFVHRLSILLVAAGVWLMALQVVGHRPRSWLTLLAPALAALFSGLLVIAMISGLGGEQAAGRSAAGAAIPADPWLALELTVVRFSLDRWPGDSPSWWLLPWLLLAGSGLVAALVDLRRSATRLRAAFVLVMLFVPLGLFLLQLVVTRLYEARYLMMIYPAWLLLLTYPLLKLGEAQVSGQRTRKVRRSLSYGLVSVYGLLLAGALLTGGRALVQPVFGLFSGDPVKEQYREAFAELATRVHPDDAIVLHPNYLRPLYDYYMARFSRDPAPEPLTFANFWQGETSFGQREWDLERRAGLAGFTRSLLVIAPEHARTVDPPLPGDEYGLVGNYWRFSREQRTWPCGIWRFNGAHLLCQQAPEPYYTGAAAPTPARPVGAVFGDDLVFQGYTLKATMPAGPGVYRAGGNVPLSLFWEVTAPLEADYSLFLHLCQACDQPPAAGEDGPPLEGYLPTSTWLPGKPARDDRTIHLPVDLAPGTYTMLLGLYDPNDPTPAGRLRIRGGDTLGDDRLVLGSIEVVANEP
ncbi:DUF2723 domain-containing protein [Candidatus Chloroploca sp. M-50]|uniref:DUF2723 domain-containing protein n=1 Tax=Candidatus Chloroploca mongolica TaxID=2528176 RepID=A0ABS4D783_9CHLR|nr:glycosyltransferase family 39 protein [Candidatus Chloroploca mongolica]MBP1465288.1 DUF2723 domain-containing protein [Candidatus Chloroploca mongolica]